MKSILALSALMLVAQAAGASDLKDCQQKIAEMVNQVQKTEARGPTGNADTYHLSRDGSCGVEYVTEKGYFTVTKFNAVANADGSNLKKFETMVLDADATSADGRVKSQVTCEINGNSVIYKTKVPLFSDGVRTPFQNKILKISQNGNQISVNVKASVLVLSSTVACNLEY